MNPLHYPSLELCKKLTEIGFMRTEKYYNPKRKSIEYFKGGLLDNGEYWCPSVMEMLDVIPDKIEPVRNDGYTFFYLEIGKKFVAYSNRSKAIKMIDGPIPNALAEMILWLHENNYISFSK